MIRRLKISLDAAKTKTSKPEDEEKIRQLEERVNQQNVLLRDDRKNEEACTQHFESLRSYYIAERTPPELAQAYVEIVETSGVETKLSKYHELVKRREEVVKSEARKAAKRAQEAERKNTALEGDLRRVNEQLTAVNTKSAEDATKVESLEHQLTEVEKTRDRYKRERDEYWRDGSRVEQERATAQRKANEYWDDLEDKKRIIARWEEYDQKQSRKLEEEKQRVREWSEFCEKIKNEKKELMRVVTQKDEELQKKDTELEDLKRQVQELQQQTTQVKRAEKRATSTVKKQETADKSEARSSKSGRDRGKAVTDLEKRLEEVARICQRFERNWFFQRRFSEAARYRATSGIYDAITALQVVREKSMELKCGIEAWATEDKTDGTSTIAPYGKRKATELLTEIGEHMQKLMEGVHEAQCSLHPRIRFQLPEAERNAMELQGGIEVGDERDQQRREAQKQMYVQTTPGGRYTRGTTPDFFLYQNVLHAHPPTALPEDVPVGTKVTSTWTERMTSTWTNEYTAEPSEERLQQFHMEKMEEDSLEAQEAMIYGNPFNWEKYRRKMAGLSEEDADKSTFATGTEPKRPRLGDERPQPRTPSRLQEAPEASSDQGKEVDLDSEGTMPSR